MAGDWRVKVAGKEVSGQSVRTFRTLLHMFTAADDNDNDNDNEDPDDGDAGAMMMIKMLTMACHERGGYDERCGEDDGGDEEGSK